MQLQIQFVDLLLHHNAHQANISLDLLALHVLLEVLALQVDYKIQLVLDYVLLVNILQVDLHLV